ncbi:ISAs1 family transposase [Microcoleus sp. Pol12B4]|uniref:ISAs1 family transposase n=1 Tax=Microcoleus sp. Pol12B4 TaxID=3055395 RepID=UPI0040409244
MKLIKQKLEPRCRPLKQVGLSTVVIVSRHRESWKETTTEIKFYLSSLEAQAKLHNQAIRSHWTMENSLHGVLDVTFNENASRTRSGYAPKI